MAEIIFCFFGGDKINFYLCDIIKKNTMTEEELHERYINDYEYSDYDHRDMVGNGSSRDAKPSGLASFIGSLVGSSLRSSESSTTYRVTINPVDNSSEERMRLDREADEYMRRKALESERLANRAKMVTSDKIQSNSQETALCDRIVAMRESKQMTQQELAERSGLTIEEIQDIENKNGFITKDTYLALMDALK